MTEAASFAWRGRCIVTVEQLTDSLYGIVTRGNPDEARWFLDRYREAVGPDAERNVGYCLGYLSKENMVKGLTLFNVEHPYFGTAEQARKLSPRQALELGREIGRENVIDGRVVRRPS